MMGALCLNLLACQHTSQTRDVLEVILPTGTEGFVEVTFGELAERVDTFPLVDGRLVMEKEGLPVSVTLKYLKEQDAQLYKWMRLGIMGIGMNLPGKIGRGISVTGYKICQKIFKFN